MMYMVKQRYHHRTRRVRNRRGRSMILGPLFIYYKIVMTLFGLAKDYVMEYAKGLAIGLIALGLAILVFFVFPHLPIKEEAVKSDIENGITWMIIIFIYVRWIHRLIKKKRRQQ